MSKKDYRLQKKVRNKAAVAVAAFLSVNAVILPVHSADELIGRCCRQLLSQKGRLRVSHWMLLR